MDGMFRQELKKRKEENGKWTQDSHHKKLATRIMCSLELKWKILVRQDQTEDLKRLIIFINDSCVDNFVFNWIGFHHNFLEPTRAQF